MGNYTQPGGGRQSGFCAKGIFPEFSTGPKARPINQAYNTWGPVFV